MPLRYALRRRMMMEANAPGYEVAIEGSFSAYFGYLEINGTKYTSATTLNLPHGTVIKIVLTALQQSSSCYVKVNGVTVQSGSGTYYCTLTAPARIVMYNSGMFLDGYRTCDIIMGENILADLTSLTSYNWRKDSSNYATITELTAGSVTYRAVASNSNRYVYVSFSVPLTAGSYTLAWDYEVVSGSIPYPCVAVYTDDVSTKIVAATTDSPLSFTASANSTVRVLLYANSAVYSATNGYIRFYNMWLVKTS